MTQPKVALSAQSTTAFRLPVEPTFLLSQLNPFVLDRYTVIEQYSV